MNQNKLEAIRQRAYEIWEEEGRPAGRQRQHWLAAEAEFNGVQGRRGRVLREGVRLPQGVKGETRAASSARDTACCPAQP